MKTVARMLIGIGILSLLTANTAFGIDFSNGQHQARIGIGYAGGYTLSHLYKRQLGMGHEAAIIFSTITMVGLSVAYDYGVNKSNTFNGGNTASTALGAGVAVFTFSLFDGSDAPEQKYYNDYDQMQNSPNRKSFPKVSENPYPNYFSNVPPAATAPTTNTQTVNININDGKVEGVKKEETKKEIQ